MAIDVEIRPLRRDESRGEFRCGEPALDRFFRHYSGQNQFKLHVALTYVAATGADGGILGFATVAAANIERSTVPSDRLRRKLPAYPLPVLRLARLGVDQAAHGFGIGVQLLRHVLLLATRQRDMLGCVGVVTDAKPGSLAFYERFGFAPLAGAREGVLHGDPTPMFLGMATIETALRR